MAEKKRLALALALLFAVNSIIISQAQSAQAATYRVGSTGSEVRTIQTKLKNWGYYDGSVDGIYGSQSASLDLLARVISAEARGEPYSGQVAVGAVILNRVEHPSFPNTVAGVVYQPGAFTCMVDGQIDQPVADSAVRAAREALNGADPSGGAIYYFNPSTATSAWIWSRPLIKVIGNHRFCS